MQNPDNSTSLRQIFALARAEKLTKQELSSRIEHYLTWTVTDLQKLLKAETLTALDHILLKIIVNAADTGSMERLDNLMQKVTMEAPADPRAPQLNLHVDAELIGRAVKKNYQRMLAEEAKTIDHEPLGEVH